VQSGKAAPKEVCLQAAVQDRRDMLRQTDPNALYRMTVLGSHAVTQKSTAA